MSVPRGTMAVGKGKGFPKEIWTIWLIFALLIGPAYTQPVFAQEEVNKAPVTLHTYTLEEVVVAGLQQNPLLREAKTQVSQAQANLIAARGTTELQGFISPVLGAGSLHKLEWAERAVKGTDERLWDMSQDEFAWEGGLRVGFSKFLNTGGAFSLSMSIGTGGGLDSDVLESEVYTSELRSELSWKQPFLKSPDSAEPWWTIKTAEDAYEKAELTREATVRSVIITVTDLFFKAVEAQEQLEIALEILESIQEQSRVVESKVSRGIGGPLDLRVAEIELTSARNGVAESRRSLDLARRQLSHATGLSLGNMSRLLPPPPVMYDTPLDATIARALNDSAALKTQEIELNAARRSWKRAQAETRPSVDTSVAVDQSGAWRIGVEVTWSFWDGHAAKQRGEAAALELQKVTTRLETMTEDTKLAIRQEYYEYLTAEERVELAELHLARVEEMLDITRQRYGLRMATELEMMDSLNQLREAKAQQARATYHRTVAAIRLLARTDQLIRVFPNIGWGQLR